MECLRNEGKLSKAWLNRWEWCRSANRREPQSVQREHRVGKQMMPHRCERGAPRKALGQSRATQNDCAEEKQKNPEGKRAPAKPEAVKRSALTMAAFGHDGERGMRESGISTTRSRNWMVLLQRLVMRTPQGKTLKSALVGCLRGSKEVGDTGKKVGFPKHAIKGRPNSLWRIPMMFRQLRTEAALKWRAKKAAYSSKWSGWTGV